MPRMKLRRTKATQSRTLNGVSARGLAREFWPSFLASRRKAIALEAWRRGEQYNPDADGILDDFRDGAWSGAPFLPDGHDDEYDELATKMPSPWAGLVTRSIVQMAYVEGVRRPKAQENMRVWEAWQRNRQDSGQTGLHTAAVAHGLAYGLVIPGRPDPLAGGVAFPKYLQRSAIRMAAFYEHDEDEWAIFAIDGERYVDGLNWGWNVVLYDERAAYQFNVKGDGADESDWEFQGVIFEHDMKVPPVARCVNSLDLDGHATGEIEPVIPLLRRIDQDVFDRLIVQRFGAWKIRYIAGMAKPSTQQAANLQALKLKVEDLLISDNKDTKFGVLEGTDPQIFANVTDADLRMLSAVAQIPPHHLLGLSSNLQAEALVAAEAGLIRKSADFRVAAGEFHEQRFRMTAFLMGIQDEAAAFDMQVRWKDTEARSLVQTVTALGTAATQLGVPVEMLWERIPDWTDSDTLRAKNLIESGDSIDAVLQEMANEMKAASGASGGA